MKSYVPHRRTTSPPRRLEVPSAWRGLERILPDLLTRFEVGDRLGIEFGVDYGYSLAVLSAYFERMIGVDHFRGDEHAGRRDVYAETAERLARFPNIELLRADYRDVIAGRTEVPERFDLAHIDLVHTYEATFEAGLWAAERGAVVLFHDTVAYRPVAEAAAAVAEAAGRTLHNYSPHHGLGIVV